MEKSIITSGKTIDLAIESALSQLGLDRDSVSVTVLQQAKSGFLGFGAQSAKVQVTYEVPDPVPEKEEKPKSALGSASRSKPKAPVQFISQSPLFQTNKAPSVCRRPNTPVLKRQQGRNIHVFQPLPYSLIHRHFFSIQNIHSLHPVADENFLSLLDNGRNKIFRQHSGIRLPRHRSLPCGRTIQMVVFLGIITPSHITPRTNAVTVRQA